uniref:Secreted protein n=1 Tax=Ixodes scapularis TaxID=6945 RepID=A0A1S4L0K2_IXOSC
MPGTAVERPGGRGGAHPGLHRLGLHLPRAPGEDPAALRPGQARAQPAAQDRRRTGALPPYLRM